MIRVMCVRYRILVAALICWHTSNAQSDPSPRSLPYSESFGFLLHGSPFNVQGWQSWQVGATASAMFSTAEPIADLPLIGNSAANINTGGAHNYNGKVGWLNSGAMDAALVLAVSTLGRKDIVVYYDIMTIRNPWNGTSNTRISEATLQYRIGEGGSFTTLTGIEYSTSVVAQTSAVTTPQNLQARGITLPTTCDNRQVVQLRWLSRDVSGAGSRPSIAVDNISVSGSCATATIEYTDLTVCSSEGTLVPAISGTLNGTFTSTTADVDASTGLVHLANSSSGNVTYTIIAAAGCPGVSASDALSISIAATADAGGPYVTYGSYPVSLVATANGSGHWSGGLGTFQNAAITANDYTPAITEWGATLSLQWMTDDPDDTGPCSASTSAASLHIISPNDGNIYGGGPGRGDHAAVAVMPTITSSVFLGGQGRGDAASRQTPPSLPTRIFTGGQGRGDISASHNVPVGPSGIYKGGAGRGDHMSVHVLPARVQVSLRAFLAGPFDPSSGLMYDSLRAKGLVPLEEPYTAMGYALPHGGGESIPANTLADQGGQGTGKRIVDWVVVELRDSIYPADVMSTRCALLQRDGDVVELDGESPVVLEATPSSYYIAMRHRNHLGVMSSVPFALGASAITVDLTLSPVSAHGIGPLVAIDSTWALWPGDVTSNGTVKYTGAANDRDPILTTIGGTVPTAVVHNTYATSDVNMDGRVKYTGQGNDRDIILQVIGGSVPTNVRNEQIP